MENDEAMTSRRITGHVFAAVLCATMTLAGCATTQPAPSGLQTPRELTDVGRVVEVIDGDTLRLQVGRVRETVRLIGIDTPETKHPTKGEQCFGGEASMFLSQLLPPGSTLRLERDVEARDAYGRLLLYLYATVDGREVFVNSLLVSAGLARVLAIEPNMKHQSTFVQAAFDAQRNARGLWAACK